MPIYEYVCKNCNHVLEVLQSAGQNNPGQNCPDCGGTEFSKKISAANVGRGTRSVETESTHCCGRSDRSSSCPPGGCCGGHGQST